MGRVIFVYAGDPHNNLNFAPFTITRHVYLELQKLFDDVVYYDWCHCGPFVDVNSDDIIIGHPNYPQGTATRYLFNKKCRAKILIFPFHHAMPDINFPFDDLVRKSDAVLSITGKYWIDTIKSTKFAHWESKITRLDMAIDSSRFPFVKTKFGQNGKRSFFYIGSDRPEKGLDNLRSIFSGTSHVLHLYGMIDGANPIARLPNVKLHGWAETSVQFARDLAATADCYVHGGISDANPTTLLEAACWGFPAACTPQSGYWPGKPFLGLNTTDIDGCRNLLNYIQTADESVLLEHNAGVRTIINSEHTWEIFVKKISDTIKRFL